MTECTVCVCVFRALHRAGHQHLGLRQHKAHTEDQGQQVELLTTWSPALNFFFWSTSRFLRVFATHVSY